MNYKIGLDLSYRAVGIAILSSRSLKYDSLIIKEKLDQFDNTKRIVDWIFEQIDPYLFKEHQLVIEDVFYGRNFKAVKLAARVQGAVTNKYYTVTNQKPIYKMAVSARKAVGVRARASKSEIQQFIIEKFKLGKLSNSIKKDIKDTLILYKEKSISSSIFKNTMGRISTRIKKETGINEHVADAILLAL